VYKVDADTFRTLLYDVPIVYGIDVLCLCHCVCVYGLGAVK